MLKDAFARFRDRPCPEWFVTPQLGIFIHWGLYSVPAWAPRGRSLDALLREDYDRLGALQPYAEWYGNAMRLPGSTTAIHHDECWGGAPYANFRAPFDDASQTFDAAAWVDLFVAAGAASAQPKTIILILASDACQQPLNHPAQSACRRCPRRRRRWQSQAV
jgi:hypothetical protein